MSACQTWNQGIRNVDTRLPSQPLSIESVGKIQASIFTIKIGFWQFVVAQKFLILLYNRVMELNSGLCVELQSYETQVIMDFKFSSKNLKIYKLEILVTNPIKSGMV